MMKWLMMLRASLAALCLGSIMQLQAALPTDLASVPGNAYGFAHFRVKDAWKTEGLAPIRGLLERLGEETLQKFDGRFKPKPSSLEAVTFYVLPIKESAEPPIMTLMRFSDEVSLLSIFPEGATLKKIKSPKGEAFLEVESGLLIAKLDAKTISLSTLQVFEMDAKFVKETGALDASIAQAATGEPLIIAGNVEKIVGPAVIEVEEPFRALAAIEFFKIAVGMDQIAKIKIEVNYGTKEKLAAAVEAKGKAISMGKAMIAEQKKTTLAMIMGDGKPAKLSELPNAMGGLFGYANMLAYEKLLDELPIKTTDTSFTSEFEMNNSAAVTAGVAAVGVGLLLPAVQKVREAAARAQSQNNLKQIGLCFHNYHDTYTTFPTGIMSKTGKPLLSWRVQILPFIEQEALYRQFKLDEPWDSEHNKKLIPMMPKVFHDPRAVGNEMAEGKTHYLCLQGPTTPFGIGTKSSFANIVDGTSNTLMVAEAADAVEWTKPVDLPYDPNKPLPKFGCYPNAIGFNALLCDGSVRFVRNSIDPKTLHFLIQKADGMPFSID
jgi:hypothetical protein